MDLLRRRSGLVDVRTSSAPALGVQGITTSMFTDNEASVRLFASCGFERVGLCARVAYLDGVWKDLAIVQRAVAP